MAIESIVVSKLTSFTNMRKLYSISLRRRLANDDNIKTEYKRKNNIEDKSYSIIEELK